MTEKKPSFFTRLGLAWRVLLGGEPVPAPLALPAPAPVAPPAPPPEKTWASGLYLLAILQREGRLIDFLMEDVTAASDADLGAAARVVHQGCRKVILQSVNPSPAVPGDEGASVTVPAGFDANRYRLVGNLAGAAPYHGALKHHGWVAQSVSLPELPTAMDPRVLAPAEVELSCSSARYCIGIDLGTTHTALSYQRLDADAGRGANQPVLPVPQLTAPGTVEERQLLPSFLYLAQAEEFPKGALALPWKSDGPVAGELARSHGVKVPTRLVSSAKSWLCHPGVDRRSALLPFNAPAEVQKISPVEAQARLLGHLEHAWDKAFGKDAPLAEQEVVVTVPASFDAAARDLTLEAAKQAGLGKVTLLEEPQAALYAWLEAQGEGFRKQLHAGDVILVVDVGGGTSDFSLISVSEKGGDLALERLAVGDHILLGGDNMDLALAYQALEGFKAQGKTLDNWQLVALTASARTAKETLFEKPRLEKAPLVVPGRGASLLGGTLKSELSRDALQSLLVDGFFPRVNSDEALRAAAASGLRQLGLPYAQDAAITRHLGHFLTRQAASLPAAAKGKSFVHPTCVLFNGGVFKAEALRTRVKEVLDAWLAAEKAPPARELLGADLDLSVARGAAHYGWVKAGHGIRIRGGTARAYYVGVESSMPAVPGFAPRVKALCVAPFGMEEGSQADVPPQEFGLVVGEATRFRFFSSSTRRTDKVGAVLDDAEGAADLEELPPIESTLPPSGKTQASALVPIQMQAAVTELGQLELRCLERGGKGKWKLELNVRLKE